MACTQARLEGCSCERGCLSCVHMAGCGEYNEGLEKPAARVILRWLLQGETPPPPAPAEAEREEAHAREQDATAGAKGDGGQAPAEEQAAPGQIAGGVVGAAELVAAPGAKRSKC